MEGSFGGNVVYVLRGDLNPFKQDLSQAEAAAKSAGAQGAAAFGVPYKTRLEDISKRLTSAGDKALGFANRSKIASGIAIGGLYMASKAASDLNETMAFTDVTFGNNAAEMKSWADNALDSMGLARESALDAANGFGGLFDTIGLGGDEAVKLSKQMVQLAVDMSSAKNVPLDEALQALKAGLIGEAEPMRRFNVLLSENEIQQYAVKEGIAGSNAELTEAQKVQARLGIIMRDTNKIQGDYARTADSAANSQRRAGEAFKDSAASLGQALAPIMADVADLAADAFEKFSKLPDPIQKSVIALGAMVALASPLSALAGGILKVSGAIIGLASTETLAGIAQMSRVRVLAAQGAVSVTTFAGALGKIAPWATVAFYELETLNNIIHRMRTNVHGLGDFLMEEIRGGFELAGIRTSLPEGALLPDVGKIKQFRGVFSNVGGSIESTLTGVKVTADKTKDQFGKDVDKMGDDVAKFAGRTRKEVNEWRRGLVAGFNGASAKLSDFSGDTKVTAAEMVRAMRRQAEAMTEYEANWSKLLKRKLPDDLREQLAEMGIEGADAVKAWANMNDEQFERAKEDWKRAGSTSKDVSRKIGNDLLGIGNKSKEAAEKAGSLETTLRRLKQLGDIQLDVAIDFATSFQGGDPSTWGDFGTGGGLATTWAKQAIAAVPGPQSISSTYRSPAHNAAVGGATNSLHMDRSNPATDVVGSNLAGVFNWLAMKVGGSVRELIYAHSIIRHGQWGYYAPSDHYDHVHVADQGGWFRGPGVVGIGPNDEYLVPAQKMGPLPTGATNVVNVWAPNAAPGEARRIKAEVMGALKAHEKMQAREAQTRFVS